MAVYQEKDKGTWRVVFRYTDFTGERKQTQKRGFKTKREATAWEHEMMLRKGNKLDMTFESFYEIYSEYKRQRVKESTFETKSHIVRTKILPYFGKRKINEIAVADVNVQVSESVELVAESKHQLEEINSQIVDKEKEYAAHEKKIDTLLAAERPVKRELALIRQDTKQLPAILGGEPYFKISERNLNKLMEMAQGAGTLKNLTMAYEKEISAMKKTIDRLSAQVKTLRSKVKQYETFLDLRGLMDAFVEYIRPKTVQEQLAEKKAIVEKEKGRRMQEVDVKKKHDIAI